MSVAQKVGEINQRIAKSGENRFFGGAGEVVLLAASKAQDEKAIEEAIAAGIYDFGENRVQEAQGKWPTLKARHGQVRLHLIGALQRNKVADAVALFDVIQSVDREALAVSLAEEMKAQKRQLPCYIQVNTGAETQKAGVSVEETAGLVDRCRVLGLEVAGLMCVPPVGQHPAPHFALLAKLAKAQGLAGLSMGMSEDYETAIRMGATCVRLGRVLFGERADLSGLHTDISVIGAA